MNEESFLRRLEIQLLKLGNINLFVKLLMNLLKIGFFLFSILLLSDNPKATFVASHFETDLRVLDKIIFRVTDLAKYSCHNFLIELHNKL